MKKISIEIYKKNEYCIDILTIKFFKFLFKWFIDCGDWFIYVYWGFKYLRFSSAGFLYGKISKYK